jgi:thiamine-phosphate pyrophosphorylase
MQTKNSLIIPRLYPIINIDTCLNPFELASALVQENISVIQLRAKKIERQAFMEIAKKVKQTIKNNSAQTKLIINDDLEVCIATKADGVHLGQGDTQISKARALLGSEIIIGLSTHSTEQIAQSNLTAADYIGFGPIFSTTTKENPSPTVGTEILQSVVKISNKPIVAIGGINSRNAKTVFDSGINSVAIIADLEKEFFGSPKNFSEYVKKFSA